MQRIISSRSAVGILVLAIALAIRLLSGFGLAADSKRLTVLVAASAQEAVGEIAEAFRKRTGIAVQVSPGPSQALARQMIEGAPAHLFLSASPAWAERLVEEGLARQSIPLVGNELALITPRGNPAGVQSPSDLTSTRVQHLALAGEKVPAGTYAEQALRTLKLEERLRPKIVRGHDVRAALALVERAEAEAGIVYATDAKQSDNVQIVYRFDPETHAPIVYPLVLLKSPEASPAAEAFFKTLQSEEADKVFRAHGFRPLFGAARRESQPAGTSVEKPSAD